MADKEAVPTFDKLFNPTLRALHKLGGSASIQELVNEIVSDLSLSEEVSEIPHGKGSQTEVAYRAAWARNYLKNSGLLENSGRGVWALTASGRETLEIDPRHVVREVQRVQREKREPSQTDRELGSEETEDRTWQDNLLEVLLQMDSSGFEIVQRVKS
ncbi:MAG: winged helix-turn-helix domain-containing protein [Deltaproteobacteria bacterium]|nr:winged helix-turn-helix domain-containing protein [Deltaproteobacteria bacterium]